MSEDRLHRYLALALGAGAGALLLARGPVAVSEGPESAPSARSEPAEANRADLDRAIAALAERLARVPGTPPTALEANLRLLALGPAALAPGDLSAEDRAAPPSAIRTNLEAIAATATAQPASLPDAPEGDAEREADPLATLVVLLEAGTPLERRLPLASGSVSVGRLLELAVPGAITRSDSLDPWPLDLLAFAVLAGAQDKRDELARRAQASLRRLDREQRTLPAIEPGRAFTARAPSPSARSFERDLQLSSAVFRAIAVLADPGLENQALRQLNSLLRRYPDEREGYAERLAQASGAVERAQIHLEAVETLGRLEQALFGAHVALRRQDRLGPPPRAAKSMRRAAYDLIQHLEALRESGMFELSSARDAAAIERLRALAHGLRGLRAARVAT
jgi:hypothetical protein